ncbi:cyanophycinase [Flavobacterium sp. WLB]|uniref:cyanophycinase n=1 Tax=unclassified Flavobacterium TaxID=196869 RepID=UPI0006ABCB38|nr:MULTISPECIES: cyanophycinase [unclassified Flavobacterium]KOP38409.1 cyanophycinase [Flavobacterium sp. VMW]OWU89982.1 cyanophycinase [Flavobacterium sp. NLM]PUU69380.1 cyanophycinase [Flavobacterium sp. WLB]
MKNKLLLKSFTILTLLLTSCFVQAQNPKGKLFIIGGGDRSDDLMKQVLDVAELGKKDYIVVLPMSSEEPDSSFIFFKTQMVKLTSNPIVMLNFNKETAQNKTLTDSVQNAKLIFISGGDQTRFMKVVHNTPIKTAILKAYENGSTISGTSAGAAVMSEKMITGNQKLQKEYTGTFSVIKYDNLETDEGLGLLKTVVIDQHFLKRNRYNRLLSALIEFPDLTGIGIDEATAIIVRNNKVEVAGESEVIVFKNPKGIVKAKKDNLISIEKLEMSIYTAGQKFNIK